jgi:hypothetical protein
MFKSGLTLLFNRENLALLTNGAAIHIHAAVRICREKDLLTGVAAGSG